MVGRIVEIADDRRHLFVHRGFMVVKDTEGERKELGRVENQRELITPAAR